MAESGDLLRIILNSKDATHNAYKTIEIEHAEIHAGKAFTFTKSTTALGASSWIDIQINCNSTTKGVHLKQIDVNNSGGLAQIQLFEMVSSTNSTWANSTTAVTVYNKNRNSTISNDITIGYQPTLITTTCYTATIRDYYLGSTGTNQTRGSAVETFTNETILKYGTTYVFRVTNLGTAGYASVRAFFYED